MQGAAAALAGVFWQFALLSPGDEFGLAVLAAHLAGRVQRDDAFVPRSRADGGGFERDGVALAAGHCAGGTAAGVLGRGGLTGHKSQGADSHKSADDGFDKFRFHDVVVLSVDEASASSRQTPMLRQTLEDHKARAVHDKADSLRLNAAECRTQHLARAVDARLHGFGSAAHGGGDVCIAHVLIGEEQHGFA